MSHHLAECLGHHCWRFLHKVLISSAVFPEVFLIKGTQVVYPKIPLCNASKVWLFPLRCGGSGAVGLLDSSAKGFFF